MKRLKSTLITLSGVAAMSVMAHAAALVTITIDTGSYTLQNATGQALSAGTTATGDGAPVQVGYYVGADSLNPFGTGNAAFVPLIGPNSLFGVTTLSIGDVAANGGGPGKLFSDELNLFAGTNGGANDGLFPAVGTPLSIRFFNGATIAGSPVFEAVSNNLWLWQAPRNAPLNPAITLFFDDGVLRARSGQSVSPGAGLRTNTANPEAVPEPSSMLLVMSAGLLVFRRNRKSA